MLVVLKWDESCFFLGTSACEQEGGIDFHISIAEPRSAIVGTLLERFLLAGVRRQSKIEDMIAYLPGDPTEKR